MMGDLWVHLCGGMFGVIFALYFLNIWVAILDANDEERKSLNVDSKDEENKQ